MKHFRRFNLIFLPLVAFNLGSIALFNLAVDPYEVLSSRGDKDVNQSKLESNKPPSVSKSVNKLPAKTKPQTTLTERSQYRARRFKLDLSNLSITRINPKTVLLGTSTVLRLSTEHPALTKQPAYNLGLPGAKMHDIKAYFEDILATHPDVKQVVIGVDFYAFGGPETKIQPKQQVASTNPIAPESAIKPTTEVRRNKYSVSLEDLLKINFSLDTFQASLKKLVASPTEAKQIADNKVQLSGKQKAQSSSEPLKSDLLPKSSKLITKKDVKKQAKQQINKKAKPQVNQPKKKTVKKQVQMAFAPYRNNERLTNFRRVIGLYWSEKTFYRNYYLSKGELNSLKEIIDICRKRNISVKVFFSPVHAAQLEAIHTAGLWQDFEEWKRQVVKITPAWDFSDYSSITTEPINDYMENFVDSVHYDNHIGDLILNRLYNYHKDRVPSYFGPLVTSTNVESHLSQIRAQRQAWLKTSPATVQFVQDIRKQTNLMVEGN